MAKKPSKLATALTAVSTAVRGQTKDFQAVDDLPYAPDNKFQWIVTNNEFKVDCLNSYRKLYNKAKDAGKKLTIYATPKIRHLLQVSNNYGLHSRWLKDVTILKYPTTEVAANNVVRGLSGAFIIFMAEHGRYHHAISLNLSTNHSNDVIFVSNETAVVDTIRKVGRGLTKPVVFKPSDPSNFDIKASIKAFKVKHGTKASKEQIDAFIKETTASFTNYFSEVLWEEGVYGQSDEHVEVYKGPVDEPGKTFNDHLRDVLR